MGAKGWLHLIPIPGAAGLDASEMFSDPGSEVLEEMEMLEDVEFWGPTLSGIKSCYFCLATRNLFLHSRELEI